MVSSSDDGTAESSLGGVVVERDHGVIEEACQLRPSLAHVLHGSVECIARRRRRCDQHLLQLGNDGTRFRVSKSPALLERRSSLLDLVELPEEVEYPLRLGG